MKALVAKNPLIRIAVVGSDPLQFVGFRAVFHSQRDFELISSSLPDLGAQPRTTDSGPHPFERHLLRFRLSFET
jgi:hypothetical protein